MSEHVVQYKYTAAHRRYHEALGSHTRLLLNCRSMSDKQFFSRERRSALRVARAYLRVRHPHIEASTWLRTNAAKAGVGVLRVGDEMEASIDLLVLADAA